MKDQMKLTVTLSQDDIISAIKNYIANEFPGFKVAPEITFDVVNRDAADNIVKPQVRSASVQIEKEAERYSINPEGGDFRDQPAQSFHDK